MLVGVAAGGARRRPRRTRSSESSSASRSARSRRSSTCWPTCTCGPGWPAAPPTPPPPSSTTRAIGDPAPGRSSAAKLLAGEAAIDQRPDRRPDPRRHGLHLGHAAELPAQAGLGARAGLRDRPTTTLPSALGCGDRGRPHGRPRDDGLHWTSRRSSTRSTTASRRSRFNRPDQLNAVSPADDRASCAQAYAAAEADDDVWILLVTGNGPGVLRRRRRRRDPRRRPRRSTRSPTCRRTRSGRRRRRRRRRSAR